MARVLLLLWLVLAWQTGCFSQPPEDASQTWDFGFIKTGEVVTHSFTIENTSKKTLTILDVNTSCGCTASAIKKKALEPGEATAVEVKFNSKGYSGKTVQFVYVHTDDPGRQVIRFTIKAEAVQ